MFLTFLGDWSIHFLHICHKTRFLFYYRPVACPPHSLSLQKHLFCHYLCKGTGSRQEYFLNSNLVRAQNNLWSLVSPAFFLPCFFLSLDKHISVNYSSKSKQRLASCTLLSISPFQCFGNLTIGSPLPSTQRHLPQWVCCLSIPTLSCAEIMLGKRPFFQS